MISTFYLITIFCILKALGGHSGETSIHERFLCQQSCGLEHTYCSNNWIEYEKNFIAISKSGTFTEEELIKRNCKETVDGDIKNYQCPQFWNCTIDSVSKCRKHDDADCENSILKPEDECYIDCSSFYTVICSGDLAHVFKVKEDYPLCVYKGCEIENEHFANLCPHKIVSHGQEYTYCACLQ